MTVSFLTLGLRSRLIDDRLLFGALRFSYRKNSNPLQPEVAVR